MRHFRLLHTASLKKTKQQNTINEIKLKSVGTLVNLWNVTFANCVLNILHLEHIVHFKCSSITCRLVPVQTDEPDRSSAHPVLIGHRAQSEPSGSVQLILHCCCAGRAQAFLFMCFTRISVYCILTRTWDTLASQNTDMNL